MVMPAHKADMTLVVKVIASAVIFFMTLAGICFARNRYEASRPRFDVSLATSETQVGNALWGAEEISTKAGLVRVTFVAPGLVSTHIRIVQLSSSGTVLDSTPILEIFENPGEGFYPVTKTRGAAYLAVTQASPKGDDLLGIWFIRPEGSGLIRSVEHSECFIEGVKL